MENVCDETVSKRYVRLEFPDCSSNGINIDEIMVFEDATYVIGEFDELKRIL